MQKQYEKIYFTTATILEWKYLLRNDDLKNILIESFRFAVMENRARFWAFIIMENHIHLVWQILDPYDIEFVIRNLLKFTAHRFLNYFRDRDRMDELQPYIVNAKDRYYQFWERNNLSIELWHDRTVSQKINYIHRNRMRKGGVDVDYKYSSARYYATGENDWDFLV